MSLGDRDQASPFHRLGSLARIKRPLDTPSCFANGGLWRPCQQQRPALEPPPIPDALGAEKARRRQWSVKSASPSLPTGAARQASKPADLADRRQRQRSVLHQSGPSEGWLALSWDVSFSRVRGVGRRLLTAVQCGERSSPESPTSMSGQQGCATLSTYDKLERT